TLSTLLIVLVPMMQTPSGTFWDDALPALRPGPLLSHLLVIHNLSPDWVHKINGPLWSVATEWQIYFVFPALLLPFWRRWNALPTILLAFAVGYAPHFLGGESLDPASPWF